MKVSFEELIQINEIGEMIASSIVSYVQDVKHIELISRLKDFWFKYETPKQRCH